jgi:hypothetical protein
MRHLPLPGVFLVVAFALAGCEARDESATAAPDPVTVAKAADKDAAEDLAKSKIDARQWLASDKHGTFKATKAEIVKFTDACLAAGAVGVWVSGPEQVEDKELVSTLYIELPTDSAKRTKLLEIYNRITEGEQDPEKDLGQKFLVYDWD